MNDSLFSTIEKIIREEKNQDIKLKEKREFETKLLNLNQAISEAFKEIDIVQKATNGATINFNVINSQFEIAQIRHNALKEQVNVEQNTLSKLRKDTENVQEYIKKLQISLCDLTHKLSDECDILALMNKPLNRPILPLKPTPLSDSQTVANAEAEQRLQKAIERRNKAISERLRLLSQPDSGEDFIRNVLLTRRTSRFFSSKVDVEKNEPIKFSTSPAAKRQVVGSLMKVHSDMPWYQPFFVCGSVTVFLIYFCVLRQENDIDQEFTKTLYDRIDGLEKEQLLISYKYNKEHGKSVEDIERRLKEIEAEQKAALNKQDDIL